MVTVQAIIFITSLTLKSKFPVSITTHHGVIHSDINSQLWLANPVSIIPALFIMLYFVATAARKFFIPRQTGPGFICYFKKALKDTVTGFMHFA